MKISFKKSATNDNNQTVALGLALQGGGAYGAFTKGALKALLESDLVQDRKIDIQAITGTSAGAMNGLMVAHGLNTGGPEKAIRNLDALWDAAGKGMGQLTKLTRVFNPVAYCIWKKSMWPNLPKIGMDWTFKATPKGTVVKQLMASIGKIVDDWRPVQEGRVKLFVNAVREEPETKERTHCVFKGRALGPDAFAAAGSLEALGPHTIDGVDHYDGGYMRNPCFDDIELEPITDLMVITIMEGPKGAFVPMSQDDLRAQHAKPGYEVMKSELQPHLAWMRENKHHLNLHVVGLTVDERWNDTSRMNTDPTWLRTLEKKGYDAMQAWMAEHAGKLGKQSSYEPPLQAAPQPALQYAM